MNNILKLLFFGSALAFAAPTSIKTDILQLGKAATGDKYIQMFRGPSVFKPGFKWNESTSAMQFTNDGSTYFNLVSGVANSVVVTPSSSYSASITDDVILANAAGGAFSVTLPTAVGNTGKIFTIKKTDSNNGFAVSVIGTSGQTIDGLSSWRLGQQYQVLTVVSNGTNWSVQKFDPANEILSQSGTTSGVSQCTPTVWIAMNNNSVTLKPGDWRITGLVNWSGSNSWSTLELYWGGANGSGSSAGPNPPAAFAGTVLAGLTGVFNVETMNGSSAFAKLAVAPTIYVHVAPGSSNVLFLDSFVSGCTGTSMTITSEILAERIR